METAQEILNNFDWSLTTNDLIILAILVVGILFHLFFLKKDKIFPVLFSIYTSYLIILFFPYSSWLSKLSLDDVTRVKYIGFIVLILLFSTIFSKSHVFSKTSRNFIARIIKSIVFGILNTGLILSLLSTLVPLEFLNKFSGFSLNVFNTPVAQFVWLVLPFIIMLFFVKLRRKGPGRPPG